ncbi:MAG: hypothetical protein R2932_01770 [Caldilineaceae bacterium]
MTGNLTRAAELLPQALQMQEAMNATMSLGWTHQYLGILAYLQGDDGRAARHFQESLESTPQGGAQYVIPLSLEGIAGVLGMRQQPVCAAELLGAEEATRERMELPHPPIEQLFYAAILENVQKSLTPEVFADAWQRGRRLTMNEAIREATTVIRGRNNVPAA